MKITLFILQEVLSMKETHTLEYKQEITNTFLKTVSAFANYDGGTVIFGVQDDGKIIGIQNPDAACLDIENKINDAISPQPHYELEVHNPNHTVVLTVHPGLDKPYLYKGKAYKRNDTATIAVDSLELSRLILQGRNMDFEALPATNQDLSFHFLEEKAKKEIGIQALTLDVLRSLNLYSNQDGYNHAAELLADQNDFPGIDVARFGDSIDIIQKRVTFSHESVLRELEEALEVYRDTYQYEKIEGMKRTKASLIPEEAFREALANALIHRTWDIKAQIRVLLFPDRAEISSPGGLASGISKEEYLRGNLSVLRNPILGNIFYRLHMVEILGTGILRIRAAYENSLKQPVFEVQENSITVILPVVTHFDLTEDEQTIYQALSRNIPKSISAILPSVPFGRSKASALLQSLAKKNYIIIQGRGRGTKYKIL